MRFFPRSVYQQAANRDDWESLLDTYAEYVEANQDACSESMNRLAKHSFHDEVIVRVSWIAPRTLELRTRDHSIVFQSVQSTNADWRVLEQGSTLIHEVHPTGNGDCQVEVLLEGAEFYVVAKDVEWKRV